MTSFLLRTAACAVAIVLIYPAPVHAVVDNRYTVSIRPHESRLVAGAPLKVIITLQNVVSEPIGLADDIDYLYQYLIDVRDIHGRSAPKTAFGKKLYRYGFPDRAGSTITYELGPQETRLESLRVTDVFDLSKPGRYYITLIREPGSEVEQKSNTIEVETVDPDR